MDQQLYEKKASEYLHALCGVKPNRRTGSPGNRKATDLVADAFQSWGYGLDCTEFDCLDFNAGECLLRCGERSFAVVASPFSKGCDVRAEMVVATNLEELEQCNCKGKILLLTGSICSEQLMPKNFVFYNPDHHKHIYATLEAKESAAIVTATGKNPELVGGEYPFAMIEDGDFNIPSVYCKDTVGEDIAAQVDGECRLRSTAHRIPARAHNVIAHKNPNSATRVVVCAHIDARANTPGASDNAAGVTVLLLLAEMLKEKECSLGVELVAFNGEDYYSAGGEMDYLKRYENRLGGISVVVNLDDIGYVKGKTAFSFYECTGALVKKARNVFSGFNGLMEGEPWYQGDHMVFVQSKVPAIAITSENMPELMATITHTPNDTPDIVDCGKLVETARALTALLVGF